MSSSTQAPANEGLKQQLATTAAAQERGISAQQAGRVTTVAGWLTASTTPEEIGRALPNGADPKRWVRIILTETRKNPGLLDADHRSFALAVMQAAQMGLEPGPLGHSYLTGPFTNKNGIKEVVLILGYKGLMDLAYRAGTVDFIDAVPVRAGEPFRIVRGSDYRLEHEELASCADHEVVGYYAIAFPKGSPRAVFEVMWPDEVDDIRKRSRASRAGPWVTDFEAMALKSPIRRMVNRGKVRLSPTTAGYIAEDEAREFGYDRPEVVDASVFALGAAPAAAARAAQVEKEGGEAPQAGQGTDGGPTAEAPAAVGAGEVASTEVKPPSDEAAPSTTAEPEAVCEICGVTGLLHDQGKHDQWAAEHRAKKNAKEAK